MDFLFRALFDIVQIHPTEVTPIGILVDIEHVWETEIELGKDDRNTAI